MADKETLQGSEVVNLAAHKVLVLEPALVPQAQSWFRAQAAAEEAEQERAFLFNPPISPV